MKRAFADKQKALLISKTSFSVSVRLLLLENLIYYVNLVSCWIDIRLGSYNILHLVYEKFDILKHYPHLVQI